MIAYVPEGAIDPPAGHMRFAGTISIPEAAFEATLEGAARSFRRAGFRDIVLIGDHGGYQESLAKVAAKLDREWAASPVRVHAVERVLPRPPSATSRRRSAAGLQRRRDRHARRRRRHLAVAGRRRAARSQRRACTTAARSARPNGVHGDPRRASAAAGRAGVDLIVARTRDAIQREVARR